jgi:hypothetical protein
MPTTLSPGTYAIGAYTVHFPTAEQARGRYTQEGWEYGMPGKIEGLTGTGIQIFNAAKSAIQAIPIYPALLPGSSLPGYPFTILTGYTVDVLSNGVADFTVDYRGLTPDSGVNVLRVSVGAQQVQTNLDINGKQLTVVAPPSITSDATLTGELAYVKKDQGKTVSAFRPQAVVEVTRLEIGKNPVVDASLYVGTVNSGACPWDPTAKARTWMCMSIDSESRDLGVTTIKTYRFQRAAVVQNTPLVTGWDAELAWIDPRNGNAPPDIGETLAFGVKTASNTGFQMAPMEDFTVFAFLFPY